MTEYKLDDIGPLIEASGQLVAEHQNPEAVMAQRDAVLHEFARAGIEPGDEEAMYGAVVALLGVQGMIADAIDRGSGIDPLTAMRIGGNVAGFVTALRPYLPTRRSSAAPRVYQQQAHAHEAGPFVIDVRHGFGTFDVMVKVLAVDGEGRRSDLGPTQWAHSIEARDHVRVVIGGGIGFDWVPPADQDYIVRVFAP